MESPASDAVVQEEEIVDARVADAAVEAAAAAFPAAVPDTSAKDTDAFSTVRTGGALPSPPASSIASSEVDVVLSPSDSVFAALFKNGRILDIPCGAQIPCKSRRCDPEVPATLHPTALQMTRLHIPWIDRFPFPKLRDNIILLSPMLDEEDFLHHLFTTKSFTLVPGSKSWDPDGWIIDPAFNKKWGYLFY